MAQIMTIADFRKTISKANYQDKNAWFKATCQMYEDYKAQEELREKTEKAIRSKVLKDLPFYEEIVKLMQDKITPPAPQEEPKPKKARAKKLTAEEDFAKFAKSKTSEVVEVKTATGKKARAFNVAKTSKYDDAAKVTKKASKKSEKPKSEGVRFMQYSEKCVAFFGDTKPYKEVFRELGARFCACLQVDGERVAGWVFPISKAKELKSLTKKVKAIEA